MPVKSFDGHIGFEVMMTKLSVEYGSAATSGIEFTLPTEISELTDNTAAVEFIRSYRSTPKMACPRCASRFTKRVNSKIFLDLHRCIDCSYMFNTLSGTIFQGTKLPIVKIVQAIIMVDSNLNETNLRDMAYALDVSYKTALGIQRKIFGQKATESYITFDGDYADFDIHDRADGQRFAHYCAMNKINLDRAGFFRRLRGILDVRKDVE